MYGGASWTEARHVYEPGEGGACQSGWLNQRGKYVPCRSSQADSVLHYNEEAERREAHDHDGGDCLCFEDESLD